MGLRGPMLRRSTDPISALTGCHAPARGAGRTAHAPGSPTPPLGPLGPQERAGDRRGARRAPPAEPPEALSPPLAGFPRARPRPDPRPLRPRAPDAPPSFSFFSMAVRVCLSTGRRRAPVPLWASHARIPRKRVRSPKTMEGRGLEVKEGEFALIEVSDRLPCEVGIVLSPGSRPIPLLSPS